MKAVFINDYGPVDEMQVGEIDQPPCTDREILVRVRFASINPIDWKIRRGDFKLIVAKRFPRVVGVDLAGEVVEVGQNVPKIKPGDQVFGMCDPIRQHFGSCAEYALCEYNNIAILPPELSLEHAASLPVAGLTAFKSLHHLIDLQKGGRVFIHGAAGGVGSFAVQMAKALGATVVATCGSDNIEFVRSLGADVVHDYNQLEIDALEGNFDGILDASAKLSFGRIKRLMKPKASYVTTVPDKESALAILLSKVLPGRKAKLAMAGSGTQVRFELLEVAKLVISGDVKPVITDIIALKDVPEAHAASERGHGRGKTLVRID